MPCNVYYFVVVDVDVIAVTWFVPPNGVDSIDSLCCYKTDTFSTLLIRQRVRVCRSVCVYRYDMNRAAELYQGEIVREKRESLYLYSFLYYVRLDSTDRSKNRGQQKKIGQSYNSCHFITLALLD